MLNPSFVFFASSRSVWWYWEQCDSVAKVIVLFLVACSIWSVSSIVKKILELRKMNASNKSFEAQLQRITQNAKMGEINSAAAIAGTRQKGSTPYAQIFDSALSALRKSDGKIETQDDVRLCVGQIENAIQRTIAKISARYEKGLGLLSTFVSGGPFLGLFGTVWGVMITFGALTEKASIAQLAPGVSGALVATTSGLLLAIPAVFAYNGLLVTVKRMSTEMENFASMIADAIELELKEKFSAERKKEAHTADAPDNNGAPAGDPAPAPGTRAPWA